MLAESKPRMTLKALICSLILISSVGCTTERAFFPTPAIPVRLATHMKDVPVYVKNTKGEYVKAYADLYPGMYIDIDPDEWSDKDKADFMNVRKREDVE